MSTRYLYFAYGSNLLEKRIHINVPSAVRVGAGKLSDYRLDFFRYSKRWHGCSATIVPHNGYDVWGAVWEIDANDLHDLDFQEGVHQGIYFRFLANLMLNGTTKECYVYQQVNNPATHFKLNELPSERQPSAAYKNSIVNGAEETKLPDHYQKLLQGILCNNFNVKLSSEGNEHIINNTLEGVPMAGCLGDQQSALVRQQCVNHGEVGQDTIDVHPLRSNPKAPNKPKGVIIKFLRRLDKAAFFKAFKVKQINSRDIFNFGNIATPIKAYKKILC